MLWLAANLIAASSWTRWKPVEGPLLVLFFAGGCWNLLRSTPQAVGQGADRPPDGRQEHAPTLSPDVLTPTFGD
jgi:hypothetical protein